MVNADLIVACNLDVVAGHKIKKIAFQFGEDNGLAIQHCFSLFSLVVRYCRMIAFRFGNLGQTPFA